MAKIHTTISVDSELMTKVKEAQFNVSQEIEQHLRNRLGQKIITPTDEDECAFCGRKERKATYVNTMGLCWICPDEVWICHKCLREQALARAVQG